MKIKIEDHDDFIVYIMAGTLNDRWVGKFKRRLLFELEQKLAVRTGGFDVILDLAGVTALSRDGAKLLKEIDRTLAKKNVGLAFCKLEPEVETVIRQSAAVPEDRLFPSIFAAELALSDIRNE